MEAATAQVTRRGRRGKAMSADKAERRVPGLSRLAGSLGLRNYSNVLKDSVFWDAFRTTFIFTGASVVLELVLGLAMAIAMHSAFKGRGLLRTVILVPWAVLTVVTAITWRSIFEPDLGFANSVL